MNWLKRTKKPNRGIRESLVPDRRFAEAAKQRFLSSYDAYQSSRMGGAEFLNKRRGGWSMAWKITGTVAAAFGIVAATSAYADVQNVAPTSMLYPLKRLAENVSLAVAPASAKPTLELSFAARRAQEINTLTARPDAAAYAPLVANLTHNMDNEVSSSLAAAASVHLKGEALSSFCNMVAPASASVSSSAVGSSSDHGGYGYGHEISIWERLSMNQALSAAVSVDCAEVTGGEVASGGSAATSTPAEASTTAPGNLHNMIQTQIKVDQHEHHDSSSWKSSGGNNDPGPASLTDGIGAAVSVEVSATGTRGFASSTDVSTTVGDALSVSVDASASIPVATSVQGAVSSVRNLVSSIPSLSVQGNDSGGSGSNGGSGNDGGGGSGSGAGSGSAAGGSGVTVTLPVSIPSINL